MAAHIGIPYARTVEVEGRWFAICPACDEHIELLERKDFESFTKREYAEHYDSCGAASVCCAPQPCDCEHCAEEAMAQGHFFDEGTHDMEEPR